MIRRVSNASGVNHSDASATDRTGDIPDDFYRRKFVEALGEGVEALKDPEIEAKVKAYFRENPDYSRDAVHVAAIACRFKKEKVVSSRNLAKNTESQQKIGSP
ncbi:MAG TPA: hypothetical protein VHC44_03390 [Verrucomicrobiae bacterium]|nr:hypothetical protein [Verrucomicrobiae bacterium]